MDEPGAIESLLWRVQAIVDYIDDLPMTSEGLEGLPEESLSAVLDRVEAARDFVTGALLSTRPEIQGTGSEFEGKWDEAAEPYRRVQPASRQGLRALVLDAVQLLEVAGWVSEWDRFTDISPGVSGDIAECLGELEAALHEIDPAWLSTRLAREDDPDERVAMAARFEDHEAWTESLRLYARLERLRSNASTKLMALDTKDPGRATDLRNRLQADSHTSDETLMLDLVAAGLTLDEARSLLAFRAL